MKTRVNGKSVETYLLDTKTSIINRIALQRGVLPDRLYTQIDTDQKIQDIEAHTLDELTKKYEGHQLELFYDTYKDKFPKYTLENIAHIWYDYRLKRGKESDPYVEITITDYLKSKNISYELLKTTLDYFNTSQQEKFNEFKRNAETDVANLKLSKGLNAVKATPLEIIKVKTELSFEVDYDIYELFNSLKMSRDMPFAVIGNYYKILKEFTPVDSWTLAREKVASDFGDKTEVLYLKLLNTLNEPLSNIQRTNPNFYSTVSIYFKPLQSDENINTVYVRFETLLNNSFTEDQLIDRLVKNFPKAVNISSKKQVGIKGEFLVPNYIIDRPVFLHSLLNDPLISRNCFTDDKANIKGEKGGIYVYFLFDPLNPTRDEEVTFSITEQVVEKTSLKVIAKDPELKPDTQYLRVRITRALTSSQALDFYSLFLTLLARYNTAKSDIFRLYESYIPDFDRQMQKMRRDIETKRKKSTRKKEMLKDIDPDQFISGYSRWLCPAKRAPKIISLKENPDDPDPPEIVQLQDADVQTMLFPKVGVEDGIKYNQYYYSCDHHAVDKFPGLRVNKLSNSEKYPIVPCCYKKDHRNKQKSIWRQYYEEGKKFSDFRDKRVDDEDDEDTHVYTTNKILPSKRIGLLSRNIDKYFSTVDISNKYLRIGVTRSCNSIIESLMMALDPDFDGYTVEQRFEEINNIRNTMLSRVYSSDVYQTAYTFSADTLSLYLKNNKKYFDPTMFLSLLEDYFKCHIFIFTQDEKNPLGILDCPKYLKRYLTSVEDKTRPYVFVYQHMGVDIDRAEYPQCELIIRTKDSEQEFSFTNEEKVVERTKKLFDEMYITNDNDKDMIVAFETAVDSQYIDYYGKARILYFSDGINIYTNPLPPLNIKQDIIGKFKPVSLTLAREFLKREKCKEKKRVVSGSLVGLYSSKGSVEFYIPIVPRDDNITIDDTLSSHNQAPTFLFKKSEMELYNDLHKMGRYITEYMFYIFSIYYKSHNGTINREYIEKFVKECISIDPTFKYGNIERLFSMNSGLLRNGKLIVHNTTILKKLIYVLRLKLKNSRESLLSYSDYSYMHSYYSDIRDFTHLESQPIIYGQDALQKWIENKKESYQIYDVIKHKGVSLYTELAKHDNKKPFVILFGASWHRPSKALSNKIFKKSETDKDSIFTKYKDRLNFVYIDIDKNKDLAISYEVSSVPYIMFVELGNEEVKEISKIRGSDNIYENIKRIDTEIKKIV